MKDRIRITVSADHTFECSTNIIGRAGESETAQLEIAVPEKLSDWWTYVEFKKPNGETFRTSNLEVENGVATYKVPLYLLSEDGEIDVQLVFQNESGKVWKSTTKKYIIDGSINATDDIPIKEDFVAQAQALVDVLSGEVQEIADVLAINPDFADAVIEACGGQTKVNTVDGQALKFWVGTQKEYDEIWVKDPMTLYYIEDDQTLAEIQSAIKGILNGTNPIEKANTAYALYSKDALNEAGHLDNLVTAGRYYCDWSAGTPSGNYGYVDVFRRFECTMQAFYEWSTGRIYLRKTSYPEATDKQWSKWKSYAQEAWRSTYTERFDIVGESYGTTISSAGLYLVEWTNSANVVISGFLFISDLNRNVSTTEMSECCAYYDAYSKTIKASDEGIIRKVFKLGNYSIGAGDFG